MNSATLSAVRTVPLRRRHRHTGIVALGGLGERDERFLVTCLVVEEGAELQLQISVAADVCVQRKGASNEEGCRAGQSLNGSYEPARHPHGPTLGLYVVGRSPLRLNVFVGYDL